MTSPRATRGIAIVVAAALAAGTFALDYALALELDRDRVFDKHNILFDADPKAQLVTLAKGKNLYGRTYQHPNLANFFNPPVRGLARLVELTRAREMNGGAVRRRIALGVVPLFSALKVLLVFVLGRALGLSWMQCTLVAALALASFTQLVFGSIPDHWGLGGFSLAASYALAVDQVRREGRTRWWAWVLVGAFTAGITITNLVSVALLHLASSITVERRLRAPLLRTAAVVAGSLLLTAALAWVGGQVYPTAKGDSPKRFRKWIQRNVNDDVGRRLVRFPAVATYAVAPPSVRTTENATGKRYGKNNDFQFTLESAPGVLSFEHALGLGLCALAAFGAAVGLRGDAVVRALTASSLAILAFSAVLHAAWGPEAFLYTQHYHLSVLVLLAGAMTGGGRRARLGTVVFGGALALVALNNAVRMADVLHRLEISPR